MVELLTLSAKARFNIAQTLSVRELDECHAQELIPTCKTSGSFVSLITFNVLSELRYRHKVHKLCEDHFSGVHLTSPSCLSTGKSMVYFPRLVEIDHTPKTPIHQYFQLFIAYSEKLNRTVVLLAMIFYGRYLKA